VLLALGLGYYGLGRFAHVAAPEAGNVIVFWPASGLLTAALLLSAPRRWAELLAVSGVAAAATNFPVHAVDVTAVFVAVDVLGPLLGAALVRWWVGGRPEPTRVRDVIVLAIGAGTIAPAAAALLASGGLELADGARFDRVWLTYFLSTSLGVLLVAPLLVAGAAFRGGPRPRRRLVELVVLTLTSALAALGFFATALPLTWVMLIVPLSAALRLGLLGAATTFAPVVICGLYATTHGHGPFAAAVDSEEQAIALLQTFAAIAGTLCNVLGAAAGQLATAVFRLRRSEERFRMLVEGVRDHAMFTLDGAGRIDSWNASAQRVFGYEASEVAGQMLADLGAGAGQEELKVAIASAADTGAFEGEAGVRRADGAAFLGSFNVARLAEGDSDGRFVVVVRDVTETRRAERQLRHMALHDTLTGLPNRALLTDRMAIALSAAQRDGDHVAVLFCDLDRFKVINDSLGHEIGDAVLTGVADRFREVVRAQDTVARHGGDEFVFCLGGVAGADEALQLAERVRAELERPFLIAGEALHVGASIGVALSFPGARPEELLRDADVAMYRAKDSGAGSALADDADRTRAIGRLRGESAVRNARERGELTLHYQPIVDMAADRIVAMEALLRWRHPVEGLLAPGDFIRVAEETGAIVEIGEWVLQEACAAGRRFRRAAPEHGRLVMNVNVSGRQLGDGLVRTVARALADTETDPDLLCLELTETTLIEAGTAHAQVIADLEALGVRLAIDDFGAGHSSLHYVRRLPVDSIKLDRSFVAGMAGAEGGAPILRAAVSMARDLDLDAVAEGVETPEERAALVDMGYRLAQGFLFARPAPEAAAAALLTRQAPATGVVTASG
jgi:diguanylate cyclase (GGDEF)-like protein/PAS domain S-box-containing protein